MNRLVPLRRLLTPREETNRPDLQVLSVYREFGVIPKDSRSDNFNKTPEDVSRYLRVCPGDLVVNKMKAWSGSVGVSRHEGIVSGDYLVCRSSSAVVPHYLHHALRSTWLIGEMRSRSKGIRPSQERLYWEDLGDIQMHLPDVAAQRRIADFLDEQVPLLDAARPLIESLADDVRARHRALLAALLDLDGPTVPLRSLCSRITSGPRGWGDLVADAGTPFIRIANLPSDGITLRLDDLQYVNAPTGPERERTRLLTGDVLMSITASLGDVGYVDDAQVLGGNVSQHVALIRCAATHVNRRWLAWALQSPQRRDSLTASGYGGTKVGLGLAEVGAIRIPLMALSHQDELVELLDREEETVTDILRSTARQVALLEERKRALITACITGTFDVTTASKRAADAALQGVAR